MYYFGHFRRKSDGSFGGIPQGGVDGEVADVRPYNKNDCGEPSGCEQAFGNTEIHLEAE
jgi:hypothetical protein